MCGGTEDDHRESLGGQLDMPATASMPTGRPTFELLAGLPVFARVRRDNGVDRRKGSGISEPCAAIWYGHPARMPECVVTAWWLSPN